MVWLNFTQTKKTKTMKCFILSLAMAVAFPFVLTAQPTITLSDLTPQYGTQITTIETDYVDPGEGGADQIWDFSDLPMNNTLTVTTTTPAGLPGAENFPNATHAGLIETEGAQGAVFSSFANNKIEDLGLFLPGEIDYSLVYSNPRTQFEAPLTMGASFTDEYASEDNGAFGGVSTITVGTISVTIDGYGTLITPQGTFEDVLRFNQSIEGMQTFISGEQQATHPFSSNAIGFIKAGISQSLLTFRDNTIFDQTENSADYFGGSITGIDDLPAGVKEVFVFPNPASSVVNVSLFLDDHKKADIKILSLDGKTVARVGAPSISAGQTTERFELPELAPGIYLVQINLGSGVVNRKLMIE
jgi:hypothetical protein